MKIALNLSDNGRLLSATSEEYASKDMQLVDALPDGNIYEYRYVDGVYIYDPLPVTEATPTETEDIAAMLIDHEYRLTLLELGISE